MPVSLSDTPTLILGPSQQVLDQPVELYRATVALALETDGVAEQICVDPATTVLTGQFQSYAFDARPLSTTALQAQGASTVRVTFSAPRRVRRVKLAAGVLASSSVKIGLHRVDVETVVEDATVTLSNNTTVTPSFADARFAIRLSDSGNLQPSQVEVVEVTSYPASPRLGITLSGVTPAPDPVYFWQGSGEIGQGGEPADGQVSAGAALAAALERLLNRHLEDLRAGGQPIPGQIQAALLVESNAPCRFQLTSLTLTDRVATASWLDQPGEAAQTKTVLRFAEQQVASVVVPIALPAGIILQTATLRAVASRAALPAAAANDEAGAPFPLPTQARGFYVDHRAVALAVMPAAALTATGIAVAVLPLAPGLALRLALHADANGTPAGTELASTRTGGQLAGQRGWLTGRLAAPLPLGTTQVWLVVAAQNGACIWLAANGDTPPGGGAIRRQTETLEGWEAQPSSDLPGLAYHLLSPVTAAPDGSTVSPALAALHATLAGSPVPATVEGDTYSFDLTQALNNYLATAPAPTPNGLVSAPLTLQPLGLRQATLYPPQLEFTPTG